MNISGNAHCRDSGERFKENVIFWIWVDEITFTEKINMVYVTYQVIFKINCELFQSVFEYVFSHFKAYLLLIALIKSITSFAERDAFVEVMRAFKTPLQSTPLLEAAISLCF